MEVGNSVTVPLSIYAIRTLELQILSADYNDKKGIVTMSKWIKFMKILWVNYDRTHKTMRDHKCYDRTNQSLA